MEWRFRFPASFCHAQKVQHAPWSFDTCLFLSPVCCFGFCFFISSRPCSNTHRQHTSIQRTALCVASALMRPSDVSPSHVCLHQETGQFPQARTFSSLGLFVGVFQVLAHHSLYMGLHASKTSIKNGDRFHCDMMSTVRRRAPVTASYRRTYYSLTIFLLLKPFDLFLFKHGKLSPGRSCSCKEYISHTGKFYAIWLRRKRQQQHER